MYRFAFSVIYAIFEWRMENTLKMSSGINILFIIIQIEMGGSEHLVYDLIRKLNRAHFNPSVAYFQEGALLKNFAKLGISLYSVPKTKRFDICTMITLRDIIANGNIHIVHAHHFLPMLYSFYGCKIANSKKLICTFHSEWEINTMAWKWKKISHFLLKQADNITGVTSKVAKAAQEVFRLPHSKISAIENGVDLNLFRRNKNAVLKKKLGIANDEKVIGLTANFRKIKNHIFLLEAFNQLVKEYKNIKLLLIGTGRMFGADNTELEIVSFIKKNRLADKVILLGLRKDIPELLNTMDIFCLPSFKEGHPISLIEAMATGLPVVGTDVEGIKEMVAQNKNGFLVTLGDAEGLKNALHRLLGDEALCKELGNESRVMAEKLYSLDACVDKYQNLYETYS